MQSADGQSQPSGTELTGVPVHPVASLFPLMGQDGLRDLARDIDAHGLLEPLWRYEGKLLDGRNRLLACTQANVAPVFRDWVPQPGETPLTFVLSRNLHRRHLAASQRAAIAVEVAAMLADERRRARPSQPAPPDASFSYAAAPPRPIRAAAAPAAVRPPAVVGGGDGTTRPGTPSSGSGGEPAGSPAHPEPAGRVRDLAAQVMQVSAGYVHEAKNLRRDDPAAFNRVRTGELSLPAARRMAAPPGAPDTAATAAADGRTGARRSGQGKARNPIRITHFGPVTSSRVTVQCTVTFGNPDIAEEILNQLNDDARVLELTYSVAGA